MFQSQLRLWFWAEGSRISLNWTWVNISEQPFVGDFLSFLLRLTRYGSFRFWMFGKFWFCCGNLCHVFVLEFSWVCWKPRAWLIRRFSCCISYFWVCQKLAFTWFISPKDRGLLSSKLVTKPKRLRGSKYRWWLVYIPGQPAQNDSVFEI